MFIERSRRAAFLGLILLLGLQGFAQCKARQVVKECKPNIAPYRYDSYTLNKITIDTGKTNVVEIEFTAFVGQQYKLVFSGVDFKEELKLNIYDRNIRVKKRNKIFDTENGIENHWAFEPQKPGTYYIDYEMPKSLDGKKKTGCVVMLIGYKE
jgi:hypothetical protein